MTVGDLSSGETGAAAGNEQFAAQDYEELVKNRSIPFLVALVQNLRTATQPQNRHGPLEAIAVLNYFARFRPIDDLLKLAPDDTESPDTFTRIDKIMVLALAALVRPIKEAANLAIRRWETEQANSRNGMGMPLTNSIVHDVTAQRTVDEVAEFIRICRTQDKGPLVTMILEEFIGGRSNRSNVDDALLYFALIKENCARDAADLLKGALGAGGGDDPDAPVPEEARTDLGTGFVATMRHLSPDPIVEQWITTRIGSPEHVRPMTRLTARLLAQEPEGASSLARHAAQAWDPDDVCALAAALAEPAPGCCASVRRFAATRTDSKALAIIIREWHASPSLRVTLDELLAEVVAGPGDGPEPRTSKLLREVDGWLEQPGKASRHNPQAARECRELFQIAMACHVTGRTGGEIARLLLGIDKVGNLHRASVKVGDRLADALLCGSVAPQTFAECLKALRQFGRRKAKDPVYQALRAVSEQLDNARSMTPATWPTRVTGGGDAVSASPTLESAVTNMADAAVLLYSAGLHDDAFWLLQHCLRNDQVMNGACINIVAGKVRQAPGMADNAAWRQTLTRTVGQWADGQHRHEAHDVLRESYPAEYGWIRR